VTCQGRQGAVRVGRVHPDSLNSCRGRRLRKTCQGDRVFFLVMRKERQHDLIEPLSVGPMRGNKLKSTLTP
jgi:hypothetical protein